jgi:RsiW-degrading membrane proteinase PrsW (M82 family)
VPASAAGSTVLLVLGFILIAVCGVITTAAVIYSTGLMAFAIGLALALVPVTGLLLYFAWLDRNEPEPRGLLVFAFGWGAAVATLGSLVLNLATALVVDATGGDAETTTVVVGAPLVEEALKGLGVLAIVVIGRRGLDGVVDGVVYAGVVAVGFAFVENILYLGAALLEGGGPALIGTFVLRGLVSPFAHPLFTAPIGIAIAFAYRRGGLNWLVVGLGYLIAVALHALWNGSAVASPDVFFVGFVLLQIPIFATYVIVALFARNREARVIRTHLVPYAQAGWLSPGELQMLGSVGDRRRALHAAERAGPRAVSGLRQFQRAAVQLALLRHRMVRGTAPPDAAAREYDLLTTIASTRSLAVHRP